MPFLTVQIEAGSKGPPPTPKGPIIQLTVAPADQVAARLLKQGLSLPQPILGHALIDTGASMSCIDVGAATRLKLPIVNVINVSSASHAGHAANVYPVKFEMVGFGIEFNIPMVVGAPLAPQRLLALIGRDVLSRCLLVYNGAIGQITLAV